MKFTEFIGINTRNMHVKFEAVRRSYNFWQKNAYSAGPSKQDEILTFTQFSPKFMKLTEVIGITTRNMHVKFEAVRRSYNFWRKNADSAGPSKQDEILTFSQSSPKFMKFTEFIEITTRNMHVKFEAVWRSYNFWQKMPTAPDLRDRMKFWLFLNNLQNSWNLQELLESPPETCMWNLRQFGEVTIFDGKMPTAPDLQNRMKFWFFSMFSKFMKFTEFIGITTRNMHVKFEAVRRSNNFWQKNAYSAGPTKQDEILTFTQCSPKFMKLTEFNWITTRNMHVKFEAVRRSYNFWRKNAYSSGL